MSSKYQNKYRISPARLQSYDYSSAGMYFITICTKDRIHYFGQIENGKMVSSELGNVVISEWIKTPVVRPDMNLEIGPFVVMPDHFHAVLIIGDNHYNTSTDTQNGNTFQPQSKNLASIMRGFKSSVTIYARKSNISFDWQPRYHDHIIRSDAEFHRISDYIVNNPVNWKKDTFNHQTNNENNV